MTISADPGNGAPAFILAVDDDPTALELTCAALEPHLGAVVEADNGLDAVKALESRNFDLAVVDLGLPVMDGFAVIERARAREETRHLPIIVMTGREDVVAIERAFALGATSFLCKPINWNIFRHEVAYVLNVARAAQRTRIAKERAERVADLRERALAALAGMLAERPDDAMDGKRLRSAIARVKQATAILTGEVRVVREGATAAGLVEAAVGAIRAERGGQEAGRIELSGNLDVALVCDRALAIQALKEVLTNALKFSQRTEKVSLAVLSAESDRVRFEITDRGCGIPEYRLADVFEPFPPGQALSWPAAGLAMAKAGAEIQGGRIGIMSERGRGTEVFLTFPAETGRTYGEGAVNATAPTCTSPLADAAGQFDT